MKIVLIFADLVGIGRRLSPGSRMVFFSAWPKDRRVRYWASDVDKVMITKEPQLQQLWYSIRIFSKDGDRADYTVSESTLLDLQNSSLKFIRSPKLGRQEAKKNG